MNRMKTLLHRPNLWPLLAANVVLSGCPTYRNAPPQITSTVPLLAALEPGKTTRQKLELSWGAPASTLQEGRIAFYRPEGSGHPRQRHDGRRRRVCCLCQVEERFHRPQRGQPGKPGVLRMHQLNQHHDSQ